MLSPSAQRVQNTLRELGFGNQVLELPQSTRSAAEAAEAVGCEIAQIVKSLVFRGRATGSPILIVASGANRVDERVVAAILGEAIERATPDFVRERTGFAIGGVPPVGHNERLKVFVDEDLLLYQEIWAAAGTPFAVFKLTPDELLRMTDGKVLALKQPLH